MSWDSSARIQPVSKAGAAYSTLRFSIRSGELAPGQRVTLKELTDPARLAQVNEELHFTLYQVCGDPLLVGFIEQLWAGMPYPFQRIYLDDSHGADSLVEHRRMVAAPYSETHPYALAQTLSEPQICRSLHFINPLLQ